MNEATANEQSFDASGQIDIPMGTRIAIYCAVWLFAGVLSAAIPDSDFTIAEQFRSTVYTPLVAVFGLALIGTYPMQPAILAIALAAIFLIAHAIFTLTQIHRKPFAVMIGLQVIIFATAAIYLMRFAHLPRSG